MLDFERDPTAQRALTGRVDDRSTAATDPPTAVPCSFDACGSCNYEDDPGTACEDAGCAWEAFNEEEAETHGADGECLKCGEGDYWTGSHCESM